MGHHQVKKKIKIYKGGKDEKNTDRFSYAFSDSNNL